ncbi:MAG TPA: nitronate monooxygenase family protein [Arthrobacter sp.]|nr:nitronate monooxygenase family protein [Arthrobacter sp.]
MIRTRLCDLLNIEYPVILAPMGDYPSAELVAAVGNAGGLGIFAATYISVDEQQAIVERIGQSTEAPFGINHLLAYTDEERYAASLNMRPSVISTSWPRADQDIRIYIARAHAVGAIVMHMVQGVEQAELAVDAGADVIVAQGCDGGSHIGSVGTLALVPQVVQAVAPVPVVAAGGIGDGSGLVAALALGADGVSMGTRFLATKESPAPPSYKRAIVASGGNDTIVTAIPDDARGVVWPNGMPRVRRNALVDRWLNQTDELRRVRADVQAGISASERADDPDGYWLKMGQGAGLIRDIPAAAEVVTRVITEGGAIIRGRLFDSIRTSSSGK